MFVIEGVTKFTVGAWVALVLIAAIIITSLRIRRYYDVTGQQLALRPEEVGVPAPAPGPGRTLQALPGVIVTSVPFQLED